MSWVKTNTYGLLDRFQIRTQQEVFKFHQINSDYNDYSLSIWIQSERDELNNQLNKMFYQVKDWLGFYPRPIWKQIKVPLDDYEFYTNIQLKIPESAHLQNFGVRAVELIESNKAFTTTGTNPIIKATFTVTTDEITDGEIALFHKAVDAFNNTADERFRVYPTNVYYNGTAYVIDVPYARLIKPELWLTEYNNGDPSNRKEYLYTDASNFVTGLDVYRVYNDDTTKATLVGAPYNFTGTTLQTQTVDAVILDEYDSVFKLVENNTYPTFDVQYVLMNCYIGYPLNVNNEMDSVIEEMIIRKSKVEMGLNARLAAAKISTMWDFDDVPAYTKMDVNSGRGGVGFMPNPIGSLNVDIEMFKRFLPIANWRGTINDSRFWIR